MELLRGRLYVVEHTEQALPCVVVAGEHTSDVDGLAGDGVEGNVGIRAHAEHYFLATNFDAAVLGDVIGGGKLLATVEELDPCHVDVEGHVVVFVLAILEPLFAELKLHDGRGIGATYQFDVLFEHVLIHSAYGAVEEGAYLR